LQAEDGKQREQNEPELSRKKSQQKQNRRMKNTERIREEKR
jgi:hypothetical protein